MSKSTDIVLESILVFYVTNITTKRKTVVIYSGMNTLESGWARQWLFQMKTQNIFLMSYIGRLKFFWTYGWSTVFSELCVLPN